MPVIIDGWNFIRHRSSHIEDEDALQSAGTLIAYLQEFQLTHSDPIIIVFDSKHEFLDMHYQSNPKLKVVAARDADNYIKRYIDRVPQKQRRSIRVVSSDNSLYYYAKDAYATSMRCEEFWNKLKPRKQWR